MGGWERDVAPLLHPFMHSLVDSFVSSNRGWNPQPWRTGLTLQPTELPGQGLSGVLILIQFSLLTFSLRISAIHILLKEYISTQSYKYTL